ncbi:MAG: copper chaperone PCu(A)C [Acidimicrobiales bacterium]
MQRNPAFILRALAAVLSLSLITSACGDDDAGGDLTRRSRLPMPGRFPAEGQTATAVYGVVSNPGAEDVRISTASSPVTDTVELHETLMDADGVMSMSEVEEGFVVPAGGKFVFEPGGPHVMLLGIDPATYPSEVEVTLQLEGADPLTFTAEVRESTDTGMHEMNDTDMNDTEMNDTDMNDTEMNDTDMNDTEMEG